MSTAPWRHQLRVVAQPAHADLAVRDRHVERAAQFDVTLDVVVGQRRFEPFERELVEHATDSQRALPVVAVDRIEDQRELVAGRGAHRPARVDVTRRRPERVQLVTVHPAPLRRERARRGGLRRGLGQPRRVGLDTMPVRAEQLIQRQVDRLGREVPERDVDRARSGTDRQEVADVLDVLPDRFALGDRAAHDERTHELRDRVGHFVPASRQPRRCVAGAAVGIDDAHQIDDRFELGQLVVPFDRDVGDHHDSYVDGGDRRRHRQRPLNDGGRRSTKLISPSRASAVRALAAW